MTMVVEIAGKPTHFFYLVEDPAKADKTIGHFCVSRN